MSLILSGTNGLSDVDGSAATPALRGTDTDTGIFFPAADTIAFAEGGAEVARFDSSGNLGIGTSSPGTKFHVDGGAVSTYMRVSNTASTNGLYVGLDSAGESLLSAVDAKPLKFATTNTERARIDSSGYLWVRSTGGTSPWDATSGTYCKFGDIYPIGATAQSNIVAIFNRNTTTGSLVECKYNGAVVGSISVTGSNTSYNTSSDYRLKNTIAPMTGALAKVALLKPCTYKWNADGSDGEGFIAHELQAVVPQCVTGEKDAVDAEGKPVYQGIDTSFLVATLTAAIQEQQALIQSLTARVAALEGTQP